jgi:hypothetical protein
VVMGLPERENVGKLPTLAAGPFEWRSSQRRPFAEHGRWDSLVGEGLREHDSIVARDERAQQPVDKRSGNLIPQGFRDVAHKSISIVGWKSWKK